MTYNGMRPHFFTLLTLPRAVLGGKKGYEEGAGDEVVTATPGECTWMLENSTYLGESQPYNELWAGQGSANPTFNARIHTVTLGTPKKVPGDAAKQKKGLHVAPLPSTKLPSVGYCECQKGDTHSKKDLGEKFWRVFKYLKPFLTPESTEMWVGVLPGLPWGHIMGKASCPSLQGFSPLKIPYFCKLQLWCP